MLHTYNWILVHEVCSETFSPEPQIHSPAGLPGFAKLHNETIELAIERD